MDNEFRRQLVSTLHVRDFRCLEERTFTFGPVTCLVGPNGSGKSSLLEALYYACYVRSFRAAHTKELVRLGATSFFIKIDGEDQIQAAFSGKKRTIKVNNKPAVSHKEILDYYRVVGLTEDDLAILQSGPQERRSFFDQVIMLEKPELASVFRAYRVILENRNALLQRGSFDQEAYSLWTDQLLEKSQIIQKERIQILSEFQETLALFIKDSAFAEHCTVSFTYKPAKATYTAYQLQEKEVRYGRTLIGAHLDDIAIDFQGKSSRLYASRGQQKLLVLLCKMVQVQRLTQTKGGVVFFLDDFMTDFDHDRISAILILLQKLSAQLIFSVPSDENQFFKKLSSSFQYAIKISI